MSDSKYIPRRAVPFPTEEQFRSRKKQIAKERARANLEMQMRVNETRWRGRTIDHHCKMTILVKEIVSQK